MSHVYTPALGLLNSTVLTGDVRAAIVMTNTDADTLVDADFMDDFALDEYDGASYVRKALAAESFAVDLANNRFKFTCDPIVWSTLGVGTRQAAGVVFYLHVTNDADSKPLMYVNSGGFPVDGNGEDFTFTPHADGGMYLRNAD
jgi:hypothetical protein